MRLNMIICGIGGQGNILASGLIASALLEQGYKVTVGETYGASQRGGSVMSHVRVSDDAEGGVLIPKGEADIVVAFEPLEALRILKDYGNANTTVIYDSRPAYPLGVLVGEDEYPEEASLRAAIASSCKRAYEVKATELAMESGNAKAANILLMGALVALENVPVEADAFMEAMRANFSGSALALNEKVFYRGYEAITQQENCKKETCACDENAGAKGNCTCVETADDSCANTCGADECDKDNITYAGAAEDGCANVCAEANGNAGESVCAENNGNAAGEQAIEKLQCMTAAGEQGNGGALVGGASEVGTQTTRKLRLQHPFSNDIFETEQPAELTFKELTELLIAEGFLFAKKGGYQYIYDDRLCTLKSRLMDYIPEGAVAQVRIHGLLTILA